jgi:hypothetical protein
MMNEEYIECDYLDENEIKEIEASIALDKTKYFRITHHYDIGNQDVYVKRKTGSIDGKRAALYCQFMAEEWFGNGVIVSNLGIAAMLVTFYGFFHAAKTDTCTDIDMYYDRERACGPNINELLNDPELARPGLKEAIEPHLDGR